MPRPKGRKLSSALPLEEQIAQVSAEIEALQEQINEKNAELARLNDIKDEEARQRLMDAVHASGKTMDDIIAMINEAAQ